MPQYRLKTKQQRLPLGGHHFPEKGTLIKGETFWEVVDTLTNFRLFNAKPLGNPAQEIVDYYASKFPWMVEFETNPKEEEKLSPDYIAWRQWIADMWGKQSGRFLSRKESSMRLEVCRTCPHNVGRPWQMTDEATEFDRKSFMLKRGNSVDEKYTFCSLHKCDVGVSSFLESPMLVSGKRKDEQDYPGCWFNTLGS